MNMPRRSTVFSAFFETFTVSVYNCLEVQGYFLQNFLLVETCIAKALRTIVSARSN